MSDLEELYQTHGAALLAYLRRSFAWCGEPEDMLHDTFVQALGQRDRLEQAASRRAWLFGIARHIGLTAARRHRPVAEISLQAPAACESPELLAMRRAMEDLPSDLRQTLELRLHDRLSYEEIAEAMEIPIGTVRSRLHAAMIRLRRALDVENR